MYVRHTFIIFLALGSLPASVLTSPEAPGVPQFERVNDHVYRGAQPTKEGLASLAKLGIKTVIDLRLGEEHAAEEQSAVESLGMRYVSVPMKAITAPTDEQISKVLSILDANSDGPVFVHCRRGKDRTGTVIACYRISHDCWQNRKALTEARSYGLSWVERGMQHYVLHFQPRAQTCSSAGL
jgi:tyrosine-protein phosphatase SIW14